MVNGHARDDKHLILIELNELNFDIARSYVEPLKLRNFAQLFELGVQRTASEERYEQLEPWVQWVSVHTGLTAAEHGVFRLGDIVGAPPQQLFEKLEDRGIDVGCLSPMNAENRLRRPSFFIPDPWTKTPSDGSFWSRILGEAISQAVNDNARERITPKSLSALVLGLLRFARPANYARYLTLAAKSAGAPWRKALFLDLFLHDLHLSLFRSKYPGFSTVFFNAGAHIQHHYMLNARGMRTKDLQNPGWYVGEDQDPMAEMLQLYDHILGGYLALPHTDLVIATGLTQKPYDRVKYYYRLKDHAAFLKALGIRYRAVEPRMTRDFLIRFDTAADAVAAQEALSAVVSDRDGTPIFGDIENRGDSLFLALTYPAEIDTDFVIRHLRGRLALKPHVSFVAIKNAMHDATGYVVFRGRVAEHAPADGAHVKNLNRTILSYFGA